MLPDHPFAALASRSDQGIFINRPGGEVLMMTDGIPRVVGVWTHPLIDVANIDTMHAVEHRLLVDTLIELCTRNRRPTEVSA